MNKEINRIRSTRLYLLESIKDFSGDQLNKIPADFNNNIIWNLGHLLAAQQGVCYIRGGLQPVLDEKYIVAYKPGTPPGQYVDDKEVQAIKELLISSLVPFEADYSHKVFENYTMWTTRYGVELSNIDDAIQFLLFHEGLHSGVITAMKKLV